MATKEGTMWGDAFYYTIYDAGNESYKLSTSEQLERQVHYAGAYWVYSRIQRCYSKPQTTLAGEIGSTAVCNKITIHCSAYNKEELSTALTIGLLQEKIGYSASQTEAYYNKIANITNKVSATISAGATKTLDIILTSSDDIDRFFENGVGAKLNNESISASSEVQQTLALTWSYTINYTDTLKKPTVTLKSKTDTTMVSSSYNLQWNYNQISDSKQNGVEIDIDNHGVWANNLTLDSATQTISGIRGHTLDMTKYPAISSSGEDVNVRMRAVSAAGVWSDYATMVLTLKYPVCVPLSPAGGENKLGNEDIVLTWRVDGVDGLSMGSYPDKYDIDYSINGGESWIALAKKITVDRVSQKYSYTIAGNTLPEGVIKWRVRGYISYSLAGEYTIDSWGEETFISKIQAGTSTITCDGKPQPTITWTSTSQVAYQVRFADYDSGAVYSTGKSHKIPKIYADGLYPVQVRTQATNGKWSDWTDIKYVQITNSTQSAAVNLTIRKTAHAVELTWTDAGTSTRYIVYRDGLAIYAGTNKTYTDVGANGVVKYLVRALKSTGYYAESAAVTVDATPANDCIYDIDNTVWIPLRYSLSQRVRNYSRSGKVVYKYYAGRTKPVAYNPGYITRQMSAGYAFKTRAEALRLNDTVGRTMIYKDTRGGVLIGVVDSVSIAVSSRLYSAQITITEVDYDEEVDI